METSTIEPFTDIELSLPDRRDGKVRASLRARRRTGG